MVRSRTERESLYRRLRRIEGQVRGVQRMLDEDRDCHEIVQQLSAVNAAVESATAAFVQAYARECLLDPDSIEPGGREATVDQILGLMTKLR